MRDHITDGVMAHSRAWKFRNIQPTVARLFNHRSADLLGARDWVQLRSGLSAGCRDGYAEQYDRLLRAARYLV